MDKTMTKKEKFLTVCLYLLSLLSIGAHTMSIVRAVQNILKLEESNKTKKEVKDNGRD